MRRVAQLFAFLVIAIGLVIIGVAVLVPAPDRLPAVAAIAPYVLTSAGLLAIGALRAAMGIVLILAAPGSRAPRALRAIGAVVFVAGLGTPIFGVERSRAVAEWAATHGAVPWIVGLLLLAFGGFIAAAVSKPRRPA